MIGIMKTSKTGLVSVGATRGNGHGKGKGKSGVIGRGYQMGSAGDGLKGLRDVMVEPGEQ